MPWTLEDPYEVEDLRTSSTECDEEDASDNFLHMMHIHYRDGSGDWTVVDSEGSPAPTECELEEEGVYTECHEATQERIDEAFDEMLDEMRSTEEVQGGPIGERFVFS